MKKTDSKLIDSSVWLAYLFNGVYSDIIESDEMLLLSVMSLFEIHRKLAKIKIDSNKISRSMEFIKKRSLVIEVSTEISEKAVDFSSEFKLSTIDSIIYATSILSDATLVTLDNDFRGLKSVVVL